MSSPVFNIYLYNFKYQSYSLFFELQVYVQYRYLIKVSHFANFHAIFRRGTIKIKSPCGSIPIVSHDSFFFRLLSVYYKRFVILFMNCVRPLSVLNINKKKLNTFISKKKRLYTSYTTVKSAHTSWDGVNLFAYLFPIRIHYGWRYSGRQHLHFKRQSNY